jgi:hypothetical protein
MHLATWACQNIFEGIYMMIEELTAALKKDDFAIKKQAVHMYGYNIWLECGFVIAVYESGKVLVQGKFDRRWGQEAVELLIPMLPPNTQWLFVQATWEPYKSLIAQRQQEKGSI